MQGGDWLIGALSKIGNVSAKREVWMMACEMERRDLRRKLNLRMLFTLGHIARSITFIQSPPMLACTPYQILEETAAKLSFSPMYYQSRDAPSHRPSVKRAPQAPIQAKTGPGNYWESNVENGTRTSVEGNEGGDKSISQPDAYPSLPPGESELHHRRHDHPSMKIR